MKTIKLFNGRWPYRYDVETKKRICPRAYIGAYSQKHAVELAIKAGSTRMNLHELNTYWNKGGWGDSMAGIEHQVGVWVQDDYNQQVKRIL